MIRRSRCLCIFAVLFGVIVSAHSQQARSDEDDDFHRGLIALQENRLPAALEAFTAAAKSQPNDARVHNFRGIALMSMGRADEAASEYRRAVRLDSHLEDALRNLGFLEWSARQTGNARRHLQRALQLAPHDAFAAYYLAQLEINDGHHDAGVALLKPFAEQRLTWAQLDLAIAYLNAGHYQDAAGTAESLVRNEHSPVPELASAYAVIGIAGSKMRHEDESIAALQHAAALAPQQEEYWLNLTLRQMESKRLSDAIASVQKGLETNPKSYALHLRLGAAYFASGKYPEAEKSFRDLVAAGDPLPTSTIGLAQVLLRTGRATQAAEVLTQAEHRLGSQFLIVYFEGLAFSRAGNRADALTAFRRAAQLNPKSAEAHLGVGKTALALGDPKEAVDELRKVHELDPANLPARRLLSQAYARLGDQASAAKYASSAVAADPEPESNLLGDFILPDWQEPTAR